jgi:hypothetical protein
LISPSNVDSKPALPLDVHPGAIVAEGTVVAVGASVPGPKVSVGGGGEDVFDGVRVGLGGAAVRVRVGVRLAVRVQVGTRVCVEVGRALAVALGGGD